VVWSVFAQKMVGVQSEAFFTVGCMNALLLMLRDGASPAGQLHALVALERFAIACKSHSIAASFTTKPHYSPHSCSYHE